MIFAENLFYTLVIVCHGCRIFYGRRVEIRHFVHAITTEIFEIRTVSYQFYKRNASPACVRSRSLRMHPVKLENDSLCVIASRTLVVTASAWHVEIIRSKRFDVPSDDGSYCRSWKRQIPWPLRSPRRVDM